ncbi:MAG: DNA-protecting protein DprA [Acidobacteria bacterium]|nr:DNA-protecting protein DprA [Acidobacteriota bacterium]
MQKDIQDWIALNLIPGLGARTAYQMLQHFKNPGEIFRANRNVLTCFKLKDDTLETILAGETFAQAEAQLKSLEELKAKAITLASENYPKLLREISDPPIVLYTKGNLDLALTQPAIGVIGARRCSTYGQYASEMLSNDLASRGITIISGLARGIDTVAHRSAIKANGQTIAVMGNGLDQVYPKENSLLAKEIENCGGIISELPLGAPPLPQNFPFRNRIIAGMCLGVLVVEAAEKSGSLITARLAMEQNREVFAIPGNITSANSFGPNYLIKDGAKLVQHWQDVVEELPLGIKARLLDKAYAENSVQTELFPQTPLSENEQKVYDLMKLDQACHIDELAFACKLMPSQLLATLLELEIKDKIKQLPGKNFIKLS